jgi:hypothetical protein
VSITYNSRYALNNVVKMRFLLDQKNSIVLSKIKDLFNIGKVTSRSGTTEVFRYTVTGFKSIYRIINYFNIFPLYTKKAHSFKK